MSRSKRQQQGQGDGELCLPEKDASAIMNALHACDIYGVGPSLEETRDVVRYIIETYPEMAKAHETSASVRDAQQVIATAQEES